MIRKIIARDQALVTYRPKLRDIGGSIAGTVLLQQIIYWDDKMGGKFFKFSEPCEHEMYKSGDSWNEELGMSAKELRTALNHFAFKCGKKNRTRLGDFYDEKRNGALVQYYTDSRRVTWYMLNREVLSKLLLGLYKESDQTAVTIITETTPETTAEIKTGVECDSPDVVSTPAKTKPIKASFQPPEQEDVRRWAASWANEKKKNQQKVVATALEAWAWYGRSDWRDRDGKQIKSWKRKIATVWFTDDKIGATQIATKSYL